MWLDVALPERRFVSTQGSLVRVLVPGVANRHEGPDFLNAEIVVDGRLLRGHIEIHSNADDWYTHGHDTDARYDSVVLHVALYGATTDRPMPMTVVLSGQLDGPFRERWREAMGAKPGIPCAHWTHEHDAARRDCMLLLCAIGRFERKVARFSVRYDELSTLHSGAEALLQTAWEGFARAAGYGGNEVAMERLARALPLRVVVDAPEKHRHAMLLAATGQHSGLSIDVRECGVLPSNRVPARLRWLAVLAPALASPAWQRSIRDIVMAGPGTAVSQLHSLLRACTSDGAPGPDRCTELLVNVIAPMAKLYADIHMRQELSKAATALYHSIHPAPQNNITRRVASAIGLSMPCSSGQQQGMIELYTEFCTRERCRDCLLRRGMES